MNLGTDFTRQAQVADSAGTLHTVTFPSVHGTSSFLPIPTIAGAYNFGKAKELTVAAGIFAPYTAIQSYPLTVDGQPAPSRYSLVSLQGSALLITGAYLAYKPIESFRVGAGIEALVGTFKSTEVFSASPADRLIAAPEDPAYDAFSQLNVGPIVAPCANFGMTAVPSKPLRIGISAQLPFWIHAPAKVDVRLPTAAPFDRAHQEGDSATVTFRLPAIARFGIEYRTNLGGDGDPRAPTASSLRLELAYVREFWSLHDTIDIRSKDIRLYDVTGFPSPFGVAPITYPRGFQDSNSFRLGGELTTKKLLPSYPIDLRAGVAYETSAIPESFVSPQTYDANKIVASLGIGIHVGEHWRMDGMGALVLLDSTSVDPAEAAIPRVDPVRGNPTATESINGGDYSARALVLGVGVSYVF